MKIWKVKRHTEHYSRSTQFPSVHLHLHWGFTTPIQRTLIIINWKVLLFLGLKPTIKVLQCLVFLWKKFVLCPLLVRKREEKGVSYRFAVRFICQEKAEQHKPFPPFSTSHLLLSRYISSSACCKSAPVFNFHRSSCRSFSLTIDKGKTHSLMLFHHQCWQFNAL